MKSLQIAATGMAAQQMRVDVISNNIANMSTAAYRPRTAEFADLAYQMMQWRVPEDSVMPGLGGVDRAALGVPSDAAYVRAYCQRRNLSIPSHFPAYIVFSFYRLIAILQGVAARAGQGSGANPESGQRLARAIPMLETLAMEALSDAKN